MRPAVLSALVGLLIVPGSAASSGPTGLHGVVSLPRPVCRVSEPCTRPASGVVLVFRRAGRAVARATSQLAGRYRVRLRPGVYVVVAPEYRMGTGPRPATVRVLAARMRRVDFVVDTGIQ